MVTHTAVRTLGIGDYSQLSYEEISTPVAKEGEILVKILACGVNNTDINTRVGWYSKGDDGTGYGDKPSPFPLIQGTDGFGVTSEGLRVLIRSSTPRGWYGSDFAGFFQQYALVKREDCFEVPESDLTPEQLGVIPCAYGTAENMLLRASVAAEDEVVVPGASGGVAGAVIELCLARGCKRIVGVTSSEVKAERLKERFPSVEIVTKIPPGSSFTCAVDNVCGSGATTLIDSLKEGGRYVTSGAIGGYEVAVDMRTVYLKDLTIFGSTRWSEEVMPNLCKYIGEGKIQPVVGKSFRLEDIEEAQECFLRRDVIGKVVLLPWG
mmetsp:Transcript_12088/g.24699  ORF Transcript_12088/g.24699 Transcript_12088/m.24699 type:complete len:322 (+) Transcript_12088:57-1022(+)